eukprot:m.4898 g.4898  ORF g.4898 m.4898 type:complete len:1233 (+) comp11517_c0_seq1:125-3823(+)
MLPMDGIWVSIVLLTLFRLPAVASASPTKDVLEKAAKFLGNTYLDSINSKEATITVDGGVITVQAAEDYELHVLELFYQAIPTFARSAAKVKFVEDARDNPLNFAVDKFVVDLDKPSLSVKTRPSPQVTIIPDFLKLSSVLADFEVIKSESGTFSLQSYSLSGIWVIGHFSVSISVAKDGSTYTMDGAPDANSVNIPAFFSAVGLAVFPSGGGVNAALSCKGLDDVSLRNAHFSAVYDADGKDYALCFSGSPSIAGWEGFIMQALYNHPADGTSAVSLAVSFKSIGLADLVAQLTNVKIDDIPTIGSLTVPEIDFLYSTETATNQLPDCLDKDFFQSSDELAEGIWLSAKLNLVSGRDPIQFIIELSIGSISFHVATGDGEGTYTFGDFLNSIAPGGINVRSFKFPPGIPNVVSLSLSSFEYAVNEKRLVAVLEISQVNIIPGFVSVSDVSLDFNMSLSKPYTTSVDGTGSWAIGSTDFEIIISPADGDGYLVTGEGSSLNIGDIVTKFSATFLPSSLEKQLKSSGFADFKIVNPAISIPVGSSSGDFEMSLSGEPVVLGLSGVTLASVTKNYGNKNFIAIGFDFAETKFSSLVKSLTGMNVKVISMLDKNMKTGFVMATRSMDDVTLPGPTVSQLTVQKGVTLAAVFGLDECDGSDVMCKFLKATLGPSASFQLKSTIESADSFSLSAGVANVELGHGVTLTEGALEFQVGEETSIGLICKLTLDNPSLLFTGSLRTNVATLEMSMTMVGIWERAFGLNWLAFGNGIFSATVVPGVAVTAFAIGGEIKIGKLNSGKEVIAASYVGVDSVDVNNNYFYGKVEHASIGNILDAFGISLRLPKVLSESGFPEGLETSFAYEEKEVPGRVIEKGFKLNGTINILGFKLSALIEIDFPSSFLIDVSMDPLKFGSGAVQIFRSKSDSKHGPRFYAHISTSSVNVKISGYANLFSGVVKNEADLEISDEEFSVTMSGVQFFLFRATFTVQASYGSLSSAKFRVAGELSTEWMREIEKDAQEVIKESAAKATKEIDKAKSDVKSAQKSFDNANKGLTAAQRKVDGVCKTKKCGKTCLPCEKFKKKKKKILGKKISVKVPYIDKCCTKITDPTCETYNAGCVGTKKSADAALAKAKTAISKMKKSLDGVKAVLSAAQVTYKAGADAASAITRIGLSSLAVIRKIDFDVEISVVSSGSFSGHIEAKLLGGKYERFGFSLKLKSVKSMAENLAKKMFPGITK